MRKQILTEILATLGDEETITTKQLAGEIWWQLPKPPKLSSIVRWLNRAAEADPLLTKVTARLLVGDGYVWRHSNGFHDTTARMMYADRWARFENSVVLQKRRARKPRSTDAERRERLKRGRHAACEREQQAALEYGS